MNKSFYVVRDNDGMYTDDRCIFYDQEIKNYRYLSYPDFHNYIILSGTRDNAENMKNKMAELCKKHNIHKNLHIETILM